MDSKRVAYIEMNPDFKVMKAFGKLESRTRINRLTRALKLCVNWHSTDKLPKYMKNNTGNEKFSISVIFSLG